MKVKINCLTCDKKFKWNEIILIKARMSLFLFGVPISILTKKCIGKETWIVHEYMGKETYEYVK